MARITTVYTLEAKLLQVLSHATRLQVLEILREGEACVCHIQATLGHRQAYVSQHLRGLRMAGLVTARREGLRVYYRASDPRIFVMLDDLHAVAAAHDPGAHTHRDALSLRPPEGACHCPRCSA